MNTQNIFPGTRVLVHDTSIYIDDIKTPNCKRPATIMCRYGKVVLYRGNISYSNSGEQFGKVEFWKYPDLVDVQFDHWEQGKLSKGHFTSGIKLI